MKTLFRVITCALIFCLSGSFASAGCLTTPPNNGAALVGGGTQVGIIGTAALAALGYDLYQLVVNVKSLIWFSAGKHNSAVKGFVCSYDQARTQLLAERAKIFDNEFDGSVKNMIIDHLTLGNLSAKATVKLLAIASMEREIAQAELTELSDFK